MILSFVAPLLALALADSAAAGLYPPPGCVEREYQGTCYLQCDTSPFIRPCGGEK